MDPTGTQVAFRDYRLRLTLRMYYSNPLTFTGRCLMRRSLN